MKASEFQAEPLLTPAQASAILGVDPKTVSRYARSGKIGYFRTLGGHRRFKESDVIALRDAKQGKGTEPEESEESES